MTAYVLIVVLYLVVVWLYLCLNGLTWRFEDFTHQTARALNDLLGARPNQEDETNGNPPDRKT